MIKTSPRTLKILAALIWYIGGMILFTKGGSLLIEAAALEPEQDWVWSVTPIGVLIGGVKAKFLFSRSCKKNLARIDLLHQPKIWQFFRPGFFIFLALMIATGATLSKMAHGSFPFLIGVAILDFSLATALLGSSYIFWTQKAFARNT
ncbi:MAG: hypothetical protein MUO76_15875 [Anaerolineaceae bacterium]|nr:hypothetical protein [Anaerolineaceae bacterium]